MRDLDQSNVEADAANDPTLDRLCEQGADCTDRKCPLQHPDDEDEAAMAEYEASISSYLDWEHESYNRGLEAESLGRPLFPNEY